MHLRDSVVLEREPGVYLANARDALWMVIRERVLRPSCICEGLRRLRNRGQVPMASYTNCIIVLLFLPTSVDLAWAFALGMAP